MFSDKKLFTELVRTPEERISTSDPRSSLTCKGWGTVKIDINNESMTLHDCLYVPNITKNLVNLLDLCSKSITIIKNGTTFQLLNDKQVLLKGQIVNKIMTVNFNQPRTLLLKIDVANPNNIKKVKTFQEVDFDFYISYIFSAKFFSDWKICLIEILFEKKILIDRSILEPG